MEKGREEVTILAVMAVNIKAIGKVAINMDLEDMIQKMAMFM